MIKNSILGKLCPVFHLWSAAVASRQNLNHGWCGRGSFLCATVKRSTPWWGGAILRVGEPRGRGRGVRTAVENYTTSINHLCPTVFLSPRVFPCSLPSPSHFLPPHSLFHGCTSPFPHFAIHDYCPPGFLPFICLGSPCTMGCIEVPVVTITTPL